MGSSTVIITVVVAVVVVEQYLRDGIQMERVRYVSVWINGLFQGGTSVVVGWLVVFGLTAL